MQTFIQGEFVDVPVVSVTLFKDFDDPEGFRLKMFFCPNCKYGVIQYKGIIASIMPGAIPGEMPLVARCASCHTKYMFIGIL